MLINCKLVTRCNARKLSVEETFDIFLVFFVAQSVSETSNLHLSLQGIINFKQQRRQGKRHLKTNIWELVAIL